MFGVYFLRLYFGKHQGHVNQSNIICQSIVLESRKAIKQGYIMGKLAVLVRNQGSLGDSKV